jgi:hypothetical protein
MGSAKGIGARKETPAQLRTFSIAEFMNELNIFNFNLTDTESG